MDDERPQRGCGQGHVTYFLGIKGFADGSVYGWLPMSTLNTIVSFNVVIKRCISHYFSNGRHTRVPPNVFLVVCISNSFHYYVQFEVLFHFIGYNAHQNVLYAVRWRQLEMLTWL